MVDSKPSKTALKREQQELQKLGESLIGLSPEQLDALPLDERLRDAVHEARRIRSNNALRRQRQYIGKLMRQIDVDPVRDAVARVTKKASADKRLFAKAERWRERILREGVQGVEAFRVETGACAEELSRLIDEHERAGNEKLRRATRRKIFRAINDVLVARQTGDRISQ